MNKLFYKKNLCFISTTRSDYGLQRNLIIEINKSNFFKAKLIIAGSHLLKKFGSTINEITQDRVKIFKKIKISFKNDDSFEVSTNNLKLSMEISKIFSKFKIDYLVLLGDRSEILSIASIAKVYNIPIIHLHGGESTKGLIDDSIRNAVSQLSEFHFVSHKKYKKKLIKMNISGNKIFCVGGLGASRIKKMKLLNKKQLKNKLNINLKKKFLLITFHPVTLENLNTFKYFKNLLESLSFFKNLNLIITSPNLDVNHNKIYNLINKFCKKNNNFYFYKSLGSELYYSLMKISSGVVGNSSSGILEAPSFKIGTVNIGSRQGGRVQAKSIINCKPEKKAIINSINKLLYNKSFLKEIKRTKNPYYKIKTEKNIIKIIRKLTKLKKI